MNGARLLLALCVAAMALSGAAAPAFAQDRTAVIVVLHDAVKDARGATRHLARSTGVAPGLRYAVALKGFSASVTAHQLGKLRADPAVSFVAPDVRVDATGTPVVAGETLPSGIRRVGAATSTLAHGAGTAAVAVLDTGIDLVNADLNATSGTNCVKPGTSAADDNGHGTHVAGIIGARNNGTGVVGMAPGTRLYAVKVLGSNGSGTLSQFLCGINWVAANAAALNIRVANMSITGSGANDGNCGNTNSDAEHKAICGAVSSKVNFVVSAGNSATDLARSIPAAYPEVLTATAMTDTDGVAGGLGVAPTCKKGELDDNYATFSNYAVSASEQAHTIAAPGTCIVSDKRGGGTVTYYGTSQAAPHVAGAVALCVGSSGVAGPCDGLSPSAVISRLRSDAASAASLTSGFGGDPLRPVTGRYYGHLVFAGGY